MQIRKPYDPVERVAFVPKGETMTKQSMSAECDINNIMAKYEKTGIINHARTIEGRYGDFVGAPEFHEAMNQVLRAEAMFAELPSSLRKRFGNDPAEFLAFAQDPANQEEIYDLGLAERPEAPAEPVAPVEPDAPPETP